MNANAQLKNGLETSFLYTFTVFPDCLNYGGTLFGGKLLAEMDLAASNAARKLLYNTDCDGLVTAHLSEVDFLAPGRLGDIIEIRCTISKVGKSSITVDSEVTSESKKGKRTTICSARFVFVSLKEGSPFPHSIILN